MMTDFQSLLHELNDSRNQQEFVLHQDSLNHYSQPEPEEKSLIKLQKVPEREDYLHREEMCSRVRNRSFKQKLDHKYMDDLDQLLKLTTHKKSDTMSKISPIVDPQCEKARELPLQVKEQSVLNEHIKEAEISGVQEQQENPLFQKLKFIKPRSISTSKQNTQSLILNLGHLNKENQCEDQTSTNYNSLTREEKQSTKEQQAHTKTQFKLKANQFRDDLDSLFTNKQPLRNSYLTNDSRGGGHYRTKSISSYGQGSIDYRHNYQSLYDNGSLYIDMPVQQQECINRHFSSQQQEEFYKLKYEKQLQEMKGKLKDKYKAEMQQELDTIKTKIRAHVEQLISQVRTEEEEKAKSKLKKYKEKLLRDRETREQDIKDQEFNRCAELMQIEKNDLKKSIEELESKYQKQLAFELRQASVAERERELEQEKKYKWEIKQLEQEVMELKLQRDRQIEVQADLTKKYQQQVQERVDRVQLEQTVKQNEVYLQNNLLRQQLNQCKEQIDYWKSQAEQLKEFNSQQTQAYQQNQCKTCNSLMIANEKLITRIKKYEKIFHFKQRSSSVTSNPCKEALIAKLKHLK